MRDLRDERQDPLIHNALVPLLQPLLAVPGTLDCHSTNGEDISLKALTGNEVELIEITCIISVDYSFAKHRASGTEALRVLVDVRRLAHAA